MKTAERISAYITHFIYLMNPEAEFSYQVREEVNGCARSSLSNVINSKRKEGTKKKQDGDGKK